MRQRQETPGSKRLLQLLGRKLAEYRETLGVTQTELARRVRVSRFQMCKHEAGSAEMPVTRFYEICVALSINPADLMRSVSRSMKS